LVVSAIREVIPILTYFVLFTAFFAFQLFILNSNVAEVEEYSQLPIFLGYFFISWGNGIGNIVNPSYKKFGETGLDTAILLAIYAIWLLNQLINLVIFLNFVIAVISDVYETVMDQKKRYIYV